MNPQALVAGGLCLAVLVGVTVLAVVVFRDGRCGRNQVRLPSGASATCGRCVVDADCGFHATCTGDHTCVQCIDDADCVHGATCTSGVCAATCTQHSDCAGHERCEAGSCAPVSLDGASSKSECSERRGVWDADSATCGACDPSAYSGEGYCLPTGRTADCLNDRHCRGDLVCEGASGRCVAPLTAETQGSPRRATFRLRAATARSPFLLVDEKGGVAHPRTSSIEASTWVAHVQEGGSEPPLARARLFARGREGKWYALRLTGFAAVRGPDVASLPFEWVILSPDSDVGGTGDATGTMPATGALVHVVAAQGDGGTRYRLGHDGGIRLVQDSEPPLLLEVV